MKWGDVVWWIAILFTLVGWYFAFHPLVLTGRDRHVNQPTTADSYSNLHIPLFRSTGKVSADLYAQSAVWDRQTNIITFQKPLLYQYEEGRCVRIVQGDMGKTQLNKGEADQIHVTGHVRARTWSKEKR